MEMISLAARVTVERRCAAMRRVVNAERRAVEDAKAADMVCVCVEQWGPSRRGAGADSQAETSARPDRESIVLQRTRWLLLL